MTLLFLIHELLMGHPIHLNDPAHTFKRQMAMVGMIATPEDKQGADIGRDFVFDIIDIGTVKYPQAPPLAFPDRINIQKYGDDLA